MTAAGPPARDWSRVRDLFDLPRDVAYLDAAAMGLHPHGVVEAGRHGLTAKARAWTLDRAGLEADAERLRGRAASLIGAEADDVAIVGSVAHGVAVAAGVLPAPAGSRILRLEDEHPSMTLAWDALAARTGAAVEIVRRPTGGDWTSAVEEALARPGAGPVAIAALTGTHWTDGARIDLVRLSPLVRAEGAALVVDATHEAGVLPIDVAALDPDFLVFPSFKWLLGPHGVAFLYAARRRQAGEPLAPNAYNTVLDPGLRPLRGAPGARRYDMGERHNPVTFPMAQAGIELMLGWGAESLSARLGVLTEDLAARVADVGGQVLPAAFRSPHVLGVRFASGLTPGRLAALKRLGVHVSERQGLLRVSPHGYNDGADIDRLVAALRSTGGTA